MALIQFPEQINGIPLSDRTRWLLFAPTWMLFPNWRRQVMERPIIYISPGLGMLRPELRSGASFPTTLRRRRAQSL